MRARRRGRGAGHGRRRVGGLPHVPLAAVEAHRWAEITAYFLEEAAGARHSEGIGGGRRRNASTTDRVERRLRCRNQVGAGDGFHGCSGSGLLLSQQLWLLAGVALFALQSSAAALVPAALGKGDTNDDDADATDAARRVADRCMGWGLFAGVGLGLLQIACLPLVRCFSPLPEVRAAARTPAFLSALAQPVNGVAFVAEGVLLGLGAFRFLAAQTAVGALAMMAFLSRAKTLSQVLCGNQISRRVR